MRPLLLVAVCSMLGCVYVDRPVVRGPVTLVGVSGASARASMVFVSARDTDDKWSKSQLYLGDATGQIATNLTNDANTSWSPALSPDGTRIVFVSSRNEGTQLYSMNIDGSDVRRLTERVGSLNHPRWSPAQRIAFEGYAEGAQSVVWTMSADGGDQTQLTAPGPDASDDGGLTFVGGGRSIVFTRYDRTSQDRDLFIVDVDGGSDPVRLTQTPKVTEALPVTSHDGRLLAYRAMDMDGHSGDSLVVLVVGTWQVHARIPLTPPAKYNINGIDFTPDDRGLVFGADATDVGGSLQNLHGELFSIDLAGTRLVRLTKNAAYDGAPVSLLASP